jgi:3-phosphoshikimate 1-carboxyvinyltransferase
MRVDPAVRIEGELEPPPDKSISHRAALLAAMSDGRSEIAGYLRSADTGSTLRAVRALGASVEERGTDRRRVDLTVEGVGLRGALPAVSIDVGNAGTLLRILPGWLAGQGGGHWTLDGDDSIRRRPVDRIAEPLRAMGARVDAREGRLPPLAIEGTALNGIRYELPVASAQVKSCLLLAGLLAEGTTTVVEPVPSRDHSERMLVAAGAPLTAGGGSISVGTAEAIALGRVQVPADFSSAAFPIVAAVLVPGSRLRLKAVGVNPTRTGMLSIMERMGAKVERVAGATAGGEPVADLVVEHSDLVGTSVGGDEVPLLIDELPLVALLGAFADGTTSVSGAEELRHKESDRIATVVEAIASLGGRIEPKTDGFVVEGGGGLRGGSVDSHGDHRLAMLGAVAGLASREGVEVVGFEAASVSYPGFASDLASLAHR